MLIARDQPYRGQVMAKFVEHLNAALVMNSSLPFEIVAMARSSVCRLILL